MKKYRYRALEYIAIVILFLLPLRHVNQGIDISDTTYNLACFEFFGRLDAMWVYVTYIANAVGHMFTLLPGGHTMLGMNVYCSLVVSIMAVTAFMFLKDRCGIPESFAGVYLAVMLCWCPHVILYNYLTYLGLLLGTIFLYRGIAESSRRFLVAAGLVLGVGVGTRFSNLTHTALIAALWYMAILKKEPVRKMLTDTLVCVAGYLAGVAAFLLTIAGTCGLEGYVRMLTGLQSMSSSGSSGYGPLAMLTGAYKDYAESFVWMCAFAGYALAGAVLFGIFKGRFVKAKQLAFITGLLVLVRLVYGRGMFGLDYTTYFSVFRWTAIFNFAVIVLNLVWILSKKSTEEEKLLSVLVLITIVILPLGSNNRSYPVINNLFLLAPVTLGIMKKLVPENFPVRATALCMLTVLLLQSTGFGVSFVFRDNPQDKKRDTKAENNAILKGMYTGAEHAENLSELSSYCKAQGLFGQEGIFYGDVPGISYIFSMPSAISGMWANLDSYNMDFWDRDFAALEERMDTARPVIFVGKDYKTVGAADELKREKLKAFMERHDYRLSYEDEELYLYR